MWFGKICIKDRTNEQNKRLENLNDRFNRWHDKQINLLTFGINLFFILSVTAIGFIFKNFEKTLLDKIIFEHYSLGRTVSIIFLFSILVGIIALVLRLNDFRTTKNVVKWRKQKYKLEEGLKYEAKEELDIDTIEKKIKNLMNCYKLIGKLTWFLFYAQLILFLLGIFIIVCNI